MEHRIAIVTGGLARSRPRHELGLARAAHKVAAVGHIPADIAEMEEEAASTNWARRILPLVADLRRPADCDRVVAMRRRGSVRRISSSTMPASPSPTIDPARYRRAEPQKFWQVPDDIV